MICARKKGIPIYLMFSKNGQIYQWDERNGLAGLRDMARIVRYVTGTLESRFTGRILLLVQC